MCSQSHGKNECEVSHKEAEYSPRGLWHNEMTEVMLNDMTQRKLSMGCKLVLPYNVGKVCSHVTPLCAFLSKVEFDSKKINGSIHTFKKLDEKVLDQF